MRIYNYDPATGEYLGTSEADQSPLEPGVYLLPAHATDQPVPTAKAGQAAVFLDGTWRLVPDYRSQPVCLIDADGYFLGLASLTLGEALDSRHILTDPPAAEIPRPQWTTDKWRDGRTPAEIMASYEAAIDARLDQFAQLRGYRDGDRLASYKGSSNATWAGEADRFIELRDQTWTKFISISADVTAGKRPMPTLDDLLLELPVLTWDSNA